jgi:hypothetical protein
MQVAGLDHQHRSGAAKHADKQEQNGSDWETITAQTNVAMLAALSGAAPADWKLQERRKASGIEILTPTLQSSPN